MEFFVGRAAYNSEEFYKQMGQLMVDTRQLTADFVNAADRLIAVNLSNWDFQIRQRVMAKDMVAGKRRVAKMVKAAGIG